MLPDAYLSINSQTELQAVWQLNRWLQKPSDLDIHCLHGGKNPGSARQWLKHLYKLTVNGTGRWYVHGACICMQVVPLKHTEVD